MRGVSDPMHVRTVLEEVLRKAKEEEIRERLRWLEEEYALGRIPSERYLELKRKYEEELKKFM
jgi:HEPN domain-containing protein